MLHADEDVARRAFAKAVDDGASPALIIEGARRYAREVTGRLPKHIKLPSNWLAGRRWRDEPSGTLTVDQDGNEIASPPEESSTGPIAVAKRLAAKYRARS